MIYVCGNLHIFPKTSVKISGVIVWISLNLVITQLTQICCSICLVFSLHLCNNIQQIKTVRINSDWKPIHTSIVTVYQHQKIPKHSLEVQLYCFNLKKCIVLKNVFYPLLTVFSLFTCIWSIILSTSHHFTDCSGILTVATRPVEALHSSVLWFSIRKLQCGVQAPETFSQRVVFVILNQLLDTKAHTQISKEASPPVLCVCVNFSSMHCTYLCCWSPRSCL